MTTHSDHPVPAPSSRPERIGFGRAMWKEVVHLLSNLPVSLIAFVYVTVTVAVGVALSVTVIGLPLLAAGLVGARLVGRMERARARGLLGVRIEEPSRP
ncbi:sensor domain-containing protein, partial [Streptomyces sp. Act-28]